MTTICLLPGIAASLLPFHRDFRSSCAIFRRRRKPQKRRPSGFSRLQPCEASVVDSGAHQKTAKRRPDGFSRIQPCEASVVDSGARRKTAKKAPGRVPPDPALRGFRRRFCTASIHRGQLSEPCEARRVCPNGCEKGVRKRQETQQVDRENPSGRRGYRRREITP